MIETENNQIEAGIVKTYGKVIEPCVFFAFKGRRVITFKLHSGRSSGHLLLRMAFHNYSIERNQFVQRRKILLL